MKRIMCTRIREEDVRFVADVKLCDLCVHIYVNIREEMIVRDRKDFPRETVPCGTNSWHGFLELTKREMCNAPSSTHLSWESITRIEPVFHWFAHR